MSGFTAAELIVIVVVGRVPGTGREGAHTLRDAHSAETSSLAWRNECWPLGKHC